VLFVMVRETVTGTLPAAHDDFVSMLLFLPELGFSGTE